MTSVLVNGAHFAPFFFLVKYQIDYLDCTLWVPESRDYCTVEVGEGRF